MNDKQILTLILKRPAICAAEIADALNVELTAVSNAMRSLVDVGDVVRTSGTAPNGQQAQLYNLSTTYRKSREYAQLVAEITASGGQVAQVPTTAPTPAPTPQPAVTAAPEVVATKNEAPQLIRVIDLAKATPAEQDLPTPTPAPDNDRRLSPMMRTERAMAFLRERGDQGARSLELAEAMGLRADQSPSNFLRTARERGQIKNTDGRWYAINQASKSVEIPVLALVPEGPFRCGIWLDDVIELQRGSVTLDKLARDEALILRDFLNRVLPQVL